MANRAGILGAAAALVALSGGSMARAAADSVKSVAGVTGEYIEARSASVYAGACHYNGEMTTAGREAVLAWNVAHGSYDGVKLDGVRVVALVAGADNLAFSENDRRTVLYVDVAATGAQRDAIVSLLKSRTGGSLGTIVAVRNAPVAFIMSADKASVTAPDIASLVISRYPCAHCRMPAETWYAPLAPSRNAEVAEGVSTGFTDRTLGVSWSQTASDNAYVGTFSL